ncbi:Fe-S cluster assembly protein SufD [Bathymodiolus platifrons methanotrophic gill symbiont]|uniref:Fe-S cluster assembly protein SufD n=1 Tax=Bathymodiolus platifrons methanotrophic gill symbiont TaxID=113268 RepID=UPI0011C7BF67|nr:Fe-S cluster assembly protein SufD [Bathymodiolus platifrons methanotrophic gill symbiont]TXL01598.1 Fe-S cluster assembly protein SufD [Methylococcaceae bacterium HT1]TXL18700.1 Fe-S cluster assembly protein SufD [Methylococcaceae bacterium HT3]TXL23842.1 Fe-S cluster assembly protein SufD [Methylococcaceae bacterium HT2]GFO74801.1 Fe-S cluster assembly protein SufD [Bathymodiolus platifrons methanotrophic gill symbiont]
MSAEQIISQYPAEYKKIADALPGQSIAWLALLRQDAVQQFSAHGFPSLREEEWRYTNVSAIEKKLFSPASSSEIGAIEIDSLNQYLIQDAWSVVLVDGHFSASLSKLDGIPEIVTVMSMSAALEQCADLLEKYFSQSVDSKEHGFVAFNTAWFSDGLFIHVPAKQVLAKSIQILHVVTQAGFMANTRDIIALEESAEVTVVETFVGCDEAYCSAAIMEVSLAQNADLTLYKLQMEGEKAYHFGGIYVKQDRDSRFTHHNFAFGGLLARNDIHTDLGQASECDLNGLYLGVKRQHIDNHTRINHLQPHAISHELYKGVLNQRAKGVFQGRVLVAEQAQKTDSMMNNRNLLLSDDAEADTKPQLEIYADDVKCAHGVTVGQLDEQSIFYLQSRCVDKQTARNMLTFAFANEMVEKIKLPELHDMVLAQLLQRFPQAGIQQDWL